MVDLLCALDFWWVVREVLVDGEGEVERSPFVHPLVRVDRERKVEYVIRVGKLCLHSAAER